MEAFAFYLLKSSVWLTGFAAIYFLFLRNERFFVLNRVFLISGIVFSIVFPFFTWRYTVVFPLTTMVNIGEPQMQAVGAANEPLFQADNLLLLTYIAGLLYLIYRLIKQTASVWLVIRKSETLHFNSVKLIRTNRYPASFSFFSFVFVNPSTHEHEINEIVSHEQEHIRQRHWIDLLLLEILCTLQWFNPMIWIYGRFIRQNHEFLADEYALRRSPNPAIYRAALLNQMFGVSVIPLSNSFNYSINKKRFNMMKQIPYSPFRKLKLLLVVPLIAGVFYAFATPEYKFIQANSEEQITQPQGQPAINNSENSIVKEKIVKGKVLDENGNPLKDANIVITGTSVGTISDASGNFELKMTDEKPIVFSYIGFDSKTVKPDFSKEMKITMKRATIGIEAVRNDPSSSQSDLKQNSNKTKEVVIIGYGKNQDAEKPESGIKISSSSTEEPLIVINGEITENQKVEDIKPETIESMNVLKDEKAIEKYGTRAKNGVIELTIKSKPLYVVNGVATDDISNIKSETIESVSVLKDKSATELYGEKGKNGVVLIVLKKAKNNADKNSAVTVIGYAANQKENKNSVLTIRSNGAADTPLIVIDGVITENKEIDDIKPETIQSINVLKNNGAIQKYGEKGKNGAVEITLKNPHDTFSNVTQKQAENSGEKSNNNETFFFVEEMPEFPGGPDALKSFVRENLRYPEAAIQKKLEGKVYVNFMISKTGAVSNVKISRGHDPILDQEALRVVKLIPNWSPGKQRGQAVDVSYTIPIEFTLPVKK